MSINIKSNIVRSGYDQKTCWVHARAGLFAEPSDLSPHCIIVTMQKLDISGSDVFEPLHTIISDDGGKTWSDPVAQSQLVIHRDDGSYGSVFCDATPSWHSATGKLLVTGNVMHYGDASHDMALRWFHPAYSVFDPETNQFSKLEHLEHGDDSTFELGSTGCTQRYDLPNGDILLPGTVRLPGMDRNSVAVARCGFDGKKLRVLNTGAALKIDVGRGSEEPSITCLNDVYFLTIRNDEQGYVARSRDGINFDELVPWRFDDGAALGSYNTQQHWLRQNRRLYLVYTRIRPDNDHVFRHRAPLLIAEVDTERLCVLRSTERILVENRGARLGNFGVLHINSLESRVFVSEWMQTWPPNWSDSKMCEKFGSNNALYMSSVVSLPVHVNGQSSIRRTRTVSV